MPGGYGRGPRRTIFSKLCNWACCWRIECLKVEMWLRTATARIVQISRAPDAKA